MAKTAKRVTEADRRNRRPRPTGSLCERGSSQPAFARALGISVDRAASIEYARTPLTVELSDGISSKFDVSLIWLATGGGRMMPCVGLIGILCKEIKPSAVLSKEFSPEVKRRFGVCDLYGQFVVSAIMTGRPGLPKGKEGKEMLERIPPVNYSMTFFYSFLNQGEKVCWHRSFA